MSCIELLESRIAPAAVLRTASGTTAADLLAARDAFRADLGGGTSEDPHGSFGGLRREIHWDEISDALATPATLPLDYYLRTSPRGLLLSGGVLAVSMDDDTGSDADPDDLRFSNLNPIYETTFTTFSGQRLFGALESPIIDVRFRVPGTATATHSGTIAAVSGFGIVFTGIETVGDAGLAFYNPAGQMLGYFDAPAGALSFLGVSWDNGEEVARVRIFAGYGGLEAQGASAVAMDDFIYSEPIAVAVGVAAISSNGRTATFTDIDGDTVTVKTTKGRFETNDFVLAPGGLGYQLQLLDLRGNASTLEGASISLHVSRAPGTGDGRVNIGHINADGLRLSNLSVPGDVGRLEIGTAGATSQAINTLTLGSLGRLGKSTQEFGGSLGIILGGNAGRITITGDVVESFIDVRKAATILIGGDLRGGFDDFSGSITAAAGIGTVRIGGNISGGSGDYSGQIFTGSGQIAGVVQVGGDLLGGTGRDSGSILTLGQWKSVSIAGDIRNTAENSAPAPGRIGANNDIGTLTVGGSLQGTSANPVIISAGGKAVAPRSGLDTAISSITIGKSVENTIIRAGALLDATPVNGDASIGRVLVKGSWIASDLIVGTGAGADGYFGTADDETLFGPGIRNQPGIFATLGSITILREVLGTIASADTYGIIAQHIVSARIGSVRIPLEKGPGSPNDFFELSPTGPGATGLSSDFLLTETVF